MKKNPYLFLFIVISLVLVTGCGNSSGGYTAGTGNTGTASGTPAETTGWKSSTYENVNSFAGVTMAVKEGTVSGSGLTVVFENNSDGQCVYGEYFCLEKKINGSWYQVPAVIDNFGFDAIGYNLASGDDDERAVKWEWLYGILNAGEYRIVKEILDFRGPGDFDTYYLAAEFIIYQADDLKETK